MTAGPAIDGRTPLAGVIGWPIDHSCSPLIHNHWLERLGLPGAYVPLPVAPGDLARALHGLRACGFRGVNVTAPHKGAAFDGCDRLTEAARRCGAVNTVTFGPDGLHGDNSDGFGFLHGLREHGVEPSGLRSVLLLGAGGAARAVAVALAGEGVAVTLCNRSPERAALLARDLGDAVSVRHWDERDRLVAGTDLLVNTTSLGTHGRPAEPPCRLDAATDALVVADIVYRPARTPLLAHAAARGLRTIGGASMLVGQATVGFRRWFGAEPPAGREVYERIAAAVLDIDGRDAPELDVSGRDAAPRPAG